MLAVLGPLIGAIVGGACFAAFFAVVFRHDDEARRLALWFVACLAVGFWIVGAVVVALPWRF